MLPFAGRTQPLLFFRRTDMHNYPAGIQRESITALKYTKGHLYNYRGYSWETLKRTSFHAQVRQVVLGKNLRIFLKMTIILFSEDTYTCTSVTTEQTALISSPAVFIEIHVSKKLLLFRMKRKNLPALSAAGRFDNRNIPTICRYI